MAGIACFRGACLPQETRHDSLECSPAYHMPLPIMCLRKHPLHSASVDCFSLVTDIINSCAGHGILTVRLEHVAAAELGGSVV